MNNELLIYAVDDEPSIREIYDYALSQAGYTVKCFSCAEELFAETEKVVPDLFILDIMLDGLSGYEILERLRDSEKTQDVPVIMVSAKTTEIDKVKGFNLGADDYVTKPFGILELTARVNAKLKNAKKGDRIISYKDVRINDDKHTVTVKGKEIPLTLKQYELLKLFIANADKVLRRNDILDKIWGENYGETRTLDIHVGDLRKVLSESDAEISTVRGVGYLLK